MNVENAWAVLFRSDPFIHHPEATIIIRQKKIFVCNFYDWSENVLTLNGRNLVLIE